eukprot:11141530-Ditylum_brightwellii.AAC.1
MAQELYYVPGGDVNDGISYFGWLIATDIKILIEGNGQALVKESLMKSLQAETYGGLPSFTSYNIFAYSRTQLLLQTTNSITVTTQLR